MATQMRRQGGRGGMRRMAMAAAGVVALGTALVLGGRLAAPTTIALPPPAVTNPRLGVDAPAGVGLRELPGGYRDYIRPTEAPTAAPQPTALGIDLPAGLSLDHLPAGLSDYVRRAWPGLLPTPATTNPRLGIDLPAGASPTDLPAGMTDYLRDRTGVSASGGQAAPVTNPRLGVDAPAGVDPTALPAGYREYIRDGR